MASATASSGCSTSVAGLLTIAFVVLKLLHKIAWSWLWVLSPVWIEGALIVLVLIVLAGVAGIVGIGALLRRK
jgi:hypothetical protein